MSLIECFSVIKYILVFVNLIFWVIGATSIALSIWMLVDQTFLVTLSQDHSNFYAGLYILLIAGALMFIVAFLGCCGAYKESQYMLVSFFSCMLLVIVAQVAAGAWLYVNSDRLEELVRSSVHISIKNEYGVISSRTKIVDIFQQQLHCCGANGSNDWAGSKYSNKGSNSEILLTVNQGTIFIVPKSCCKDEKTMDCEKSRKMRIADVIPSAIFNDGCTNLILKELRKQSCIFFGIIITFGVFEIVGLIFSLTLCCAIGSNGRYKA
ncbi:PREDICTED: tetraspanin-8 [Ceratosolen solmsi marchali]|uniref:Tetraspanin n=1 Tax=Ceratosolen solmsi marchali TaxID=326594 RepID=A0AAJ6YSE2_9HYME|nr:PREDICTED: tetraspanin-8 [Ceratosolen solmsi marchali]